MSNGSSLPPSLKTHDGSLLKAMFYCGWVFSCDFFLGGGVVEGCVFVSVNCWWSLKVRTFFSVIASPKTHWFLFDDDNDVFLIEAIAFQGVQIIIRFHKRWSCHSVAVGFVLSGSPWHQCWWSLPEVLQHIGKNASLTFNAPTGPGESYGRFGLLDFCHPSRMYVHSFQPLLEFKKKN